ncbi:MAG: hypothetical protein HQL19_00720 [Candidatus Omnitrophica bacterium]|nr:hypothetical protein [Candidatus Omnitrophota bacterium]
MLSGQVRILDFDGTVAGQEGLVRRYQPVISDLKALGPAVRLWSNRQNANKVKNILSPELKNAVTFLGSGDFHHISSLLVEQFDAPITVIVFDHHPDWDILPPKLGCGSWVSRILRRPNVKKVILLGISSDDISSYSIQTGNLKALHQSRVEIYPYAHEPTFTLFQKVPADNVSVRVENGIFRSKISWTELKGKDLTAFFMGLLGRIETQQVYLSLDKDCLQSGYALTNWEEGLFPWEGFELLLKLIREHLDIAGCDVTGDYSVPIMNGKIKTILAEMDHPRAFSAKGHDAAAIQALNQAQNLKILEVLALHNE